MHELAKPIDEITFDDVRDFCARQIAEFRRLDYKSKLPDNRKIAREVAAFANTEGGLLVFGVYEEDRKPKPEQHGCRLGNDPRDRLVTICGQHVFPPVVPEISGVLSNPNDKSLGFIVMRIPASAEIHLLDDGKEILVRHDDQKQPTLASLEVIERLIARRDKQIQIQTRRREEALARLSNLVNDDKRKRDLGGMPEFGVLTFSLGPRIEVTPQTEVRELLANSQKLGARSEWYRSSFLERWREPPIAVADGICGVDGLREWASMIDIHGNVSVYAGLATAFRVDFYDEDEDSLGLAPEGDDGQKLGVRADIVTERMMAAMLTTRNLYSLTGFAGLLEVKLRVMHTRGVPLLAGNGRILGFCPGDDEIVLGRELNSSDLATDDAIVDALSPFVSHLLWSWGFTDNSATSIILDGAEQALHGRVVPCNPNECNRSRPRNRDKCLKCRDKDLSERETVWKA